MIAALANLRDRLLGRGAFAVTAPVFDGALKPNELLQTADVVAGFNAPEDLATDGNDLFVADGDRVFRLTPEGKSTLLFTANGRITAMAHIADGLAIAVDGKEIQIHGGRFDGRVFTGHGSAGHRSINALTAHGNRLYYTDGSRNRDASQWRHDLMEIGRSGSVFQLDLDTGAVTQIAGDMAYAFGSAAHGEDIVASESWNHRLIRISPSGKPRPALDHLPGYPSRLSNAPGNGYWLSVFCVRTQLVELVLREPVYRKAMIEGIDPDLWISPQLFSYRSFHEPMQYSGLKQMGLVKPWAPPRSYGLVVRLDSELRPIYSIHSRAGGRFHGVVAMVQLGERLYLLSKGDKVVVSLDVARVESELFQ